MNYLDRKLKRFRDKKAAQIGKKLDSLGKSKAQIYQANVQEQIALETRQREIIASLPEEVKPFGAIVGRWIWIWYAPHFVPRVKPHYDLLKRLGFFWNTRRSAWQNPCGVETGRAKSDPRKFYRVTFLGQAPKAPSKEYTEAELESMGCPF
jgi:hypothetical protein